MNWNGILLQVIPQSVASLLILYWIAAQIFPSLRPRNGKNNLHNVATKEDIRLLFERYDTLIKIIQENYEKEIESHNKIIAHLLDISKTTLHTIDSLENIIKDINHKVDDIGKRSIYMDGKLDTLVYKKG